MGDIKLVPLIMGPHGHVLHLDRIGVDRRIADVPWKRPRTTDMRSGERTYKERRGECEKAS